MIVGIIIIAILLLGLIAAIFYRAHAYKTQVLIRNEEILTENQKQQVELKIVKEEFLKALDELANIDKQIESKHDSLAQLNSSIEQTTEEYNRIAEERAQKMQEERLKSLEIAYAAAVADLQDTTRQELKDYRMVKKEVAKAQSTIKDLQAKQLAYIQMKQREEEIKNQQDYYRLILSEEDKQDVKFLREVQSHIQRKDSIDKVIWEVYYKPSYDILMSHIFSSVNERKCGIYRITCLTNDKSYIGQSVNIRERFKEHIKTALAHTSTSNKLYQEMKQQGIENFIFEVVEEVARSQLNEREIYWIDFYKTRDYGMNSTRGGS